MGAMKGKSPSAAQKRFHDMLCHQVGCIACRADGAINDFVSVHHIDGRTKPGAHWLVLPLCAGHHQENTGIPGLIAVHPWKTRFIEQYGQQTDLLHQCIQILIDSGYAVPHDATMTAAFRQPEAA